MDAMDQAQHCKTMSKTVLWGVIETRGYRTKCIWLVDGIWAQISAKPLLPIVQLRGGIMRNRVVRFKTEETKILPWLQLFCD